MPAKLVTCHRCDGDGTGPSWQEMNCSVCGGGGKVAAPAIGKHSHYCRPCQQYFYCGRVTCAEDIDRHCGKHSRYCETCEQWTAKTECKQCGAPTVNSV